MSGYIGTVPVPQATQTREAFTATANQTSFATIGYEPGFLDVFLNGVKLAAADYTATNAINVVLATGAAVNDILEIVAYKTFNVANTLAPNGSAANLTNLPAAQLTGALPAISGAALTSLTSANLTGALPAVSGAALTSLTSANLTGALPAISGAALTNVPIADQAVNEAKLQVSNAPTNGYMLTAQSGNTGGLTWVAAPTSSITYAAVGTYGYFITTGTVYSITAGSTTISGSSLRPHGVTVYTLSASYTGNHHWPSPGSSPNVGTWRAMGGTGGNWAGSAKYTATLYIRIS